MGPHDPTDAYAAGLIDGEGCIYISKGRHARLDVGMAEHAMPLLEEMAARYGGAVTLTRRGTDRWQAAYCWTVQSANAAALLHRVEPMLRLKGELARIAIRAEEIRQGLIPPGGQKARWTPAALAEIQVLRQRCLTLNRKGPLKEPVRPAGARWIKPQSSLLASSGEPFSGTWPRWGMTWRGVAFELPTWEPRTDGTGSSPLLGTPRPHDAGRTAKAYPGNVSTGSHARQADGGHGDLVEQMGRLLPTPRTSDQNGAGRHGTGGPDLRAVASELPLLPTPHGMAKEGQERRPGPTGNELGRAITLLPTPRADPRDATPRTPREDWRPSLSEALGAVKLLPTPVAGDSRNSRQSTVDNPRDPTPTLSDVAYTWSGGTTVRRSADGKRSTGQRPRLSPEFVEWMMGTPSCNECGRGWTDSACPHSATAFTSMSDGCSGTR